MRSIRYFLAVGAVLAPVVAFAQAPFLGSIGDPGCGSLISDPGELYLTKVTNNPADLRTDFLFDLTAKGGQASNPGTSYAAGGWSASAAWRVGQGGSHVEYSVLTMAPATPGGPGRFAVDSGTVADFDALINHWQEVGNSIPTGELNSVGLTIPGTNAQYGVPIRPANVRQFPAGTTTNGINIAFAAAVDINDTGSATGCSWGGEHGDPLDTTNIPPTTPIPPSTGNPVHGVIIGYNIYRLPGNPGSNFTPADVKAAVMTTTMVDGGWVGFIDTRTIRQIVADVTTAGPSPLEVNATADLGGMQNPNGLAYDGDEIIIFQDSTSTPAGAARPGGATLAPVMTQDYWYFAQPVMIGNVGDFSAAGFTTNVLFNGDHRCDLDGDGAFDGVDLDNTTCANATLEFISPQAEFGLPGLGLTFNSEPLLSRGMFYNTSVALPAAGRLQFSGSAAGADVDLRFTTGLEQGSVLGYNVYRLVGENRVRVNEQPILAQGNDSNVYSVLDAIQGARGARGGSLQYMVETVYSDGTPSTFVGPFTVDLGQQPAARRRR